MIEAAIFVSDLHMGIGDNLDDFVQANEAAFVRFVDAQSKHFRGKHVDLVLLGDTLDIWQVATPEEKNAQESTQIVIEVKADVERGRGQDIVNKHSASFDALRQFLVEDRDKRRVFIIPGNHDHSLVEGQVRKVVSRAIARDDESIAAKIKFEPFYDELSLKTYAEHGNQFDPNNDYDNFSQFGKESPGFFFVRLFWNRLEEKGPHIDVWWNSFVAIWRNRLWHLISPARRYYRQYRKDPRPFERIDVVEALLTERSRDATVAPATGKPLKEFPDLLFGDVDGSPNIFSTDPATENRLRRLYHDPQETGFKEEVDKILDEKYQGSPPPVPEEPISEVERLAIFEDEYLTAVKGMFAAPGQPAQTQTLKGEALDNSRYTFVLLGHTHEEREEEIHDLGVTYYNTGSWSVILDPAGNNVSRLCYVIITRDQHGTVTGQKRLW